MDKSLSALVLSGGGSRGAYQCGVWQAMTELGIKPDMVAGVSVGAVNGAMFLQDGAEEAANLWLSTETNMVFDVGSNAQMYDFAKEIIINHGAGSTGLQSMLRKYIDEDRVRKSETDFGLLTVEFPSMKPHYMWKEDIPPGMLCDYITASASAFPYIHTYRIGGKAFMDGAYESNLPLSMALDKGAAEITAVALSPVSRFSGIRETPGLTLIQSPWDLGDFLIFDKENSRRIMRLGYLDAMKDFGIFEGEFYTFAKGEFAGKELGAADHAAKLFGLDPLILYRGKTFLDVLEKAIQGARREAAQTLGDMGGSILAFREIDKIVNKKTAVLLVAQALKNKINKRVFPLKRLGGFLDEDIAIIRFLIKYHLI